MKLHDGLKTRRSSSWKGVQLRDRKEKQQPPMRHGVHAFVGPPGCGKTLLAISFIRQYLDMGKDTACICGVEDCQIQWRVFTNLRSAQHWAQPLDVAAQILDRDEDLTHAVILLDEIQKYADSRKSMRNSNIAIGDFVSQRRKVGRGTTKLFVTTQSIDMVDKRVREQLTQSFNCWTPNEGSTVHAFVSQHQLGHLPPYMRNRALPQHKWWNTSGTRNSALYDTFEAIDAEDVEAFGVEPAIIVEQEDGTRKIMYLTGMISDMVGTLIDDGISEIDPREVANVIHDRYRIQTPMKMVSKWFTDHGFPPIGGRDGAPVKYLVVVKLPREGDEHEE
jgi:DNA polymerase III delta prime subunit